MAEYTRPTTQEEIDKNFSAIKPSMDANMAYYESSRCLFCYDAPCIKACPTEIDIPLFIKQINTQNTLGAAKTIYESNYFGQVCGKVCPTEVLCEGACVYNHQNVKPIEIGRLQSYATSQAISNNVKLFDKSKEAKGQVAIIGAGPSGISCACELSHLGYDVTIYEAKGKPSGLVIHGNAPYKITNDEVEKEVRYLQEMFGFQIHYNQKVSAENCRNLEQQCDAIFLGVGLGNTNIPNVPGKDLKNCFGATEYIELLKLDPLKASIGKKVVVVGGGNTAMDAASESARLGADVTLLYRRSKEEMGAYSFEYDLVKSAGVSSLFNTNPVEIHGSDKVESISIVQTKKVNGKIEAIPGSTTTLDCDMVIMATGQAKHLDLIQGLELPVDSKNRILVNEHSHQCKGTMYFAGGDAINGGAEVVNACADGKKAARGIHDILQTP